MGCNSKKKWRTQYLSWERAVNWNCVIYSRNYQNCQVFVFARIKRNAFLCPLMGIASCLLYAGTILCSQDFMHSAVIFLSIVSPYLDWFADRIPILLRQMYNYHFKLNLLQKRLLLGFFVYFSLFVCLFVLHVCGLVWGFFCGGFFYAINIWEQKAGGLTFVAILLSYNSHLSGFFFLV